MLKKWSRNYNGEGGIHFRTITADTGTPVMVKKGYRGKYPPTLPPKYYWYVGDHFGRYRKVNKNSEFA